MNNPIMDIAKTISTNLTAWMNVSKDLDTIKKVEEKSGVGFGTVRRTKKGDANITVEKLTLIAGAFKRHPAELLIDKALPGDYALPSPPPPPQANEPQADRLALFSPLVAEVIQIMEGLTHSQQREVVGAVKMFLLNHIQDQQNPTRRAEQ